MALIPGCGQPDTKTGELDFHIRRSTLQVNPSKLYTEVQILNSLSLLSTEHCQYGRRVNLFCIDRCHQFIYSFEDTGLSETRSHAYRSW